MEATISAHGLKLFVREQGEGYPLVLINGIGASSEMWGSAERILAASSRTIVFDSPGTGRSETPLFPRSISALARVIAPCSMSSVTSESISLASHLAARSRNSWRRMRPDRVRRLALVSTFCGWGATASDPAALGRVVANGRNMKNPLGSTYQLLALAGWSSLPWLSQVLAPTLVVAGTGDELVPASNAEQLARHLPNSSLHLLPGAEHLYMFDPAGAGARLLADFFSSATVDSSVTWMSGFRAAISWVKPCRLVFFALAWYSTQGKVIELKGRHHADHEHQVEYEHQADAASAQEQTLKSIRETQQAVVEAVRTWADAVEKTVPAVPALPFAEELPSPTEIVHTSFEFAEQLLKAQREFAENVLAAASPVIDKKA